MIQKYLLLRLSRNDIATKTQTLREGVTVCGLSFSWNTALSLSTKSSPTGASLVAQATNENTRIHPLLHRKPAKWLSVLACQNVARNYLAWKKIVCMPIDVPFDAE